MAGTVHAGVVVGLTASALPTVGGLAAILGGAVLLLVTQPVRRRTEVLLMRRFGSEDARRRALLRSARGDSSEETVLFSPELGEELARELGLRAVAIDSLLEHETVRVFQTDPSVGPSGVEVPVFFGGRRVGTVVVDAAAYEPSAGDDQLAAASELAELVGPSLSALQLRRALDAECARTRQRRTDERERLCHVVHDRVGPSLAALKMMLAARRGGANGAGLDGPALADQAEDVVREVGRVLDELGPIGLDEQGLVPALETIAARLSADRGPRIVVESTGSLADLERPVAAGVYAIAVEALSNVVRHAHARTCLVRSGSPPRLESSPPPRLESSPPPRLESSPPPRLESSPPSRRGWRSRTTAEALSRAEAGLGLRSMDRRAAELGGELMLGTSPAGGLRLEAVIPVGRGTRGHTVGADPRPPFVQAR